MDFDSSHSSPPPPPIKKASSSYPPLKSIQTLRRQSAVPRMIILFILIVTALVLTFTLLLTPSETVSSVNISTGSSKFNLDPTICHIYSQNLNRSSTAQTVGIPSSILVTGSLEESDLGLTGRIENIQFQRQTVNTNSNKISASQKSLAVIQVLDTSSQVLSDYALGTPVTGNQSPITRYDSPGPYSITLNLPESANSLVLKKSTGEILDKIYVENWEPQAKIEPVAIEEVNGNGQIKVSAHLLPQDKCLQLKAYLENTSGDISHRLDFSDDYHQGKFTKEFNIPDFAKSQPGEWKVKLVVSSFFKTSESISNNFILTISPSLDPNTTSFPSPQN